MGTGNLENGRSPLMSCALSCEGFSLEADSFDELNSMLVLQTTRIDQTQQSLRRKPLCTIEMVELRLTTEIPGCLSQRLGQFMPHAKVVRILEAERYEALRVMASVWSTLRPREVESPPKTKPRGRQRCPINSERPSFAARKRICLP